MTTTTIVLAATALLLIAYDIYAVIRWGYQGTISYVVLTDSRAYPIIAFAVGLVCGHIFWTNCG